MPNTNILSLIIKDGNLFSGLDGAGVWKQSLTDIFSSIDETMNSASIQIFPNPTSSTFNIRTATQLQNAHLEIYNLLGEEIFTTALHNNEEKINCEKFERGVYFVKITNAGPYRVQKLIIQ